MDSNIQCSLASEAPSTTHATGLQGGQGKTRGRERREKADGGWVTCLGEPHRTRQSGKGTTHCSAPVGGWFESGIYVGKEEGGV